MDYDDYEGYEDYAYADAFYAEKRYRANYSSHVFDYYIHLEEADDEKSK